ncbi:MAG: hypothetical protein HKP48_06600 [Winogradskyella sp.]|uniref:hypothetical protein n=1 Tax=Winogradskyella sp. TaxID=1883156 RepID=UPI0017B846C0|nr:hypothetical protein [Winogradskyella sp.]MBT8243633.1 hypothetical protein [Winogradskyella sp.]NNK22958.1 hypothetical protein [Winogradskyella sp.]
MKKEHIKDIFEKYKNGETSLKDEQFLFENVSELDSSLANWITSKKENKKEIPENFNEKLWKSFEKKTQPKNRLVKRVLLVAASITLFFSLYIKNQQESTQTLWEKEALLIDAKSMFPETEQNTNLEIIFEDELITVYTKTK